MARLENIDIICDQILIQNINFQLIYKVKIDGDEISNVENTNPQSFEDVKVFVGGKFNPASDATYKNLVWESNANGKQTTF